MTRRKCPLARATRGGECQRTGCECLTSVGSRICPCCLRGHSDVAFTKGSNLRVAVRQARNKEPALERLRAFEEPILKELNERSKQYTRDLRPECWR